MSLQLLAAAQYLLLRDGGSLRCSHHAGQHLRAPHGPGPDQEDDRQQAIRGQTHLAEGLEDGGQSDCAAGPDMDNGLFLFRPEQSDSNLRVHHLQQPSG